MCVILVLGALFLRRRIGDWRLKASDTAIKFWFGLGAAGFVFTFILLATVDTGEGNGGLGFFMAIFAWIAIIAGLEALARDARARALQQRTWEERMSKTAKHIDPSPGQPDPELAELMRLEQEQSRFKQVRRPGRAQLPPAVPVVENIADADWPGATAEASTSDTAPVEDLSGLILPQRAPADAPGPAAAHATLTLPVEPQPAITHAHGGVAANVHLGVQSRFGAGAPAATVRTSESVRQTAPMEASPTISASVTQMPHSTASGVQPDAIALPQTAMPQSTPVSTTPGAVLASSAPRVLGPTALGSSGRFTYQPKLVQSRLGAGSTSVEKTAGGAGAKSG
jgi:hypothetical protein